MRTRRLRSRGIAPLAWLLATASAALAPAHGQLTLAELDDGPLSNDAYVALATGADAALAAGDAALANSRAQRAAGRQREALRDLTAALDHWAGASAREAGPQALWVRAAAATGAAQTRLFVGLERALFERIESLLEPERAAWRERFGPDATLLLRGAGRARGPLVWLEGARPGTSAAALAALRLGELALERGASLNARVQYDRARRHAQLGPELPRGFDKGLARRLGGLPAEPSDRRRPAFEQASALVPIGSSGLDDERTRGRAARPGLGFLAGERLAIQTARRVHLFRVTPQGVERDGRFEPGRLLPAELGQPAWSEVARDPPGWPLRPASDGENLFLVLGRSHESEPNTLAALRPPGPDGAQYPELLWALSGNWLIDAAGAISELVELQELAEAELQPAPLVVGELVIVQARVYAGDVRSYALGLERGSGRLRWKRFLGSGNDLLPDRGRPLGQVRERLVAQPIGLAAGRLLFGGQLGIANLFDLAGRALWAFKYRRRAANVAGWKGGAPRAWTDDPSAGLLLAPFDSDRVYALSVGELASRAGASPVVAAPHALGEARELVGGGPDELVVLGRAGRETTLSSWRASAAARTDALFLGPDEDFAGRALLSAKRVCASSDHGVYLFDRERDLYLLDYAPLARSGPEASLGGDVYAAGALLCVLGEERVWVFRPE